METLRRGSIVLPLLLLLSGAHGLAGGFGTPRNAPGKKNAEKAVSRAVTKQRPARPPPAALPRSAEARDAHMAAIQSAVVRHGPSLCEALSARGWGFVDSFIPEATVAAMRAEADGMLARGELEPSESTRWDAAAGATVRYAKKNVLYTNIEGGSGGYEQVSNPLSSANLPMVLPPP